MKGPGPEVQDLSDGLDTRLKRVVFPLSGGTTPVCPSRPGPALLTKPEGLPLICGPGGDAPGQAQSGWGTEGG